MESKKSKKPKAKKPRAKKPKKEKKEHYVNGKEFTEAIKAYYARDDGDIGALLGEMIYKIAKGLSFAPNFINYSYKDDMVGDAIVKMFSALRSKKFDLEKGHNPFSYFTTIAFHAFINRIKKEKKQRELVSEYQEMVYDDLVNTYHLTDTSEQHTDTDD